MSLVSEPVSSCDPALTFGNMSGACQIGSGVFGEWFWWLYMVVSRHHSLWCQAASNHQTRSRYMPCSNYGLL